MCMIDLDPCEVWDETWRTARKEHRCSACTSLIRPGERYLNHFSVYERDSCSEKLCATCDEELQQFANEHSGARMQPSSFVTSLRGCIAEGDEDSKRWQLMLDGLMARRRRAGAGEVARG